jgi:O-antigen/teichoic acid export membrane protein
VTGTSRKAASRVLFHSFGGVSGRLAVAAFGTLNIVVLAVLLEPRDYGLYLLFIRAISLITLLGDLGQGQSAMAHFSLSALHVQRVEHLLAPAEVTHPVTA